VLTSHIRQLSDGLDSDLPACSVFLGLPKGFEQPMLAEVFHGNNIYSIIFCSGH